MCKCEFLIVNKLDNREVNIGYIYDDVKLLSFGKIVRLNYSYVK
jgi:hypothetical protein